MTATLLLPTLRKLLLPSRRDTEVPLCRIFGRELSLRTVRREDFPLWADLHLETWRETGVPSGDLKTIVQKIIGAADPTIGPVLATHYFAIHKELVEKHFFSHQQARAFLSCAFLVYDLGQRERMSAAQIARVMAGRGENIPYSRQSVLVLQAKLQVVAKLVQSDVDAVFSRDKQNEISYFGDADADAASVIVSDIAVLLGADSNIACEFQTLAPEARLDRHPPYLQMLHFQCLIAEHYDHALLDIYEFSPRGQIALWLFDQYPEPLAQGGNPFLNNAKSVETIDEKWVRSKKEAERPCAMALYRILSTLDRLQFEPRREVAGVIRAWLHRIMNLSEPLAVELPETVTPAHVEAIAHAICAGNTETFGIIEQRIVDLGAMHRHPVASGWRSRGIGDSVNTTNVSQQKIGDCDFQHVESRSIIAYEAHGGELSDVYVDEHLRTMKSILMTRSRELAGVAELDEWTIELVFIAHRVSAAARAPQHVADIEVNVRYLTFAEFLAGADSAAMEWPRYFLQPIARRGTPNAVKTKLATILAL